MLQEAEVEAEARREEMCTVLSQKNDLQSEVICNIPLCFPFSSITLELLEPVSFSTENITAFNDH